MRLRGFSVMTNILEDYNNDVEVQTLVSHGHIFQSGNLAADPHSQAMECMSTWPLIQRNKVEDSKVNVPVRLCAESDNEGVAALAKKVRSAFNHYSYTLI